MKSIIIGQAMSHEDVEHVTASLRPADMAEVKAWGRTPKQVREDMHAAVDDVTQFTRAIVSLNALGEKTPAIMAFGISPNGYIWALGTTAVEAHAREIARRTRKWVEMLARGQERRGCHRSLWTVAYEGNAVHMNWLRYAGFEHNQDLTQAAMLAPCFKVMQRN